MPLSLLPSLLLSIFIVGYSPGPANIYSLSCALNFGRTKSLKMWFGLLTGFSIDAIICCVLVHYVGMAFGDYVGYLRYLGGAYIIYLAWRIYKGGTGTTKEEASCSFLSGMIVQMTNAKMILFELTAYTTFVLPYSDKLYDLLIVAAWLLIAGPGANLIWLLAGSWLKPLFSNYKKAVNTTMALILLVCAIIIIFPGLI